MYHGDWSDPEVSYYGYVFNVYAIEDEFWEEYKEKHPEDTDGFDFDDYLYENRKEVKSWLQYLISEKGYTRKIA